MKQLSETLNDVFILESFQSAILRDLVADLKASGKWKKTGMEILPHGIAWDKIPDDDIFEGETGDQAFYNTFIKSKKFLVIWFTHLTRKTRVDSRSRSAGWYVRPGYTYITIGNQFVEYDFQKRTWDARFEAKNNWLLPVRGKYDDDEQYRNKVAQHMTSQDASKYADIGAEDKRYKPSPSKQLGPANGHCTVDELFAKGVCSCIAISLEDVAKYSTVELMKKRYEQKLNATAMMKKKVNWGDRWRKNNPDKSIYNSLSSETRSKNDKLGDRISIVDYPEIAQYNKQRYNQMIMTAKSTAILKKYANDVEEFQKVIDDNITMTHVTPLAISSIDAGKFADIYFNRKLAYSKAKTDALVILTNRVKEIVFLIEEIILIINKSKGPDYNYGKSEEEQIKDSVDTRIKRLDSIVVDAKSQCKIIAHSI